MLIITTLLRFRTRPAVADVNVNVLILSGEFLQLGLVDVLLFVAHAEEEPRLAFRAAGRNRVRHAEHGRDADAARDQHHGIAAGHVQKEMSRGRFDVQDVAFLDRVREEARGRAGRKLRSICRRLLLLDRDAVIVRAMRAVGERIATDERLVASRDVELEGKILTGLERGNRLAVMRLEVEGEDVLALGGLLHDGKFSAAIPHQAGFLGVLLTQPSFLHLQAQPLHGRALLPAIIEGAEQSAKDLDADLEQQRSRENDADGPAHPAIDCGAQCIR